MIKLNDYLPIGQLTKTHGYKGEIVLRLDNLNCQDIQEMESVLLIIDGLPVPFFIAEYSEKPPDAFIIKFDDIDDDTTARKYIPTQVYIGRKLIQSSEKDHLIGNALIGYDVTDKRHGKLGSLSQVLDYSNNPLMQILDGRKEILVPLQPEFILDIDDTKKIITVDIPEGLLDL